MSRVGLVLVSHSAKLAEGLAELAGQMASDVRIIPAGGMDDGGLGTSFDKVTSAVTDLRSADCPVLLLSDLGSATMTIETVLDMLDDDQVVFADAPLVEATVAAAVAAQQGADLATVKKTAEDVAGPKSEPARTERADGDYERVVTVVDEAGLHARPAARVAEMAGEYGSILINGAAADSIMTLMSLGIHQGDEITISTSNPDHASGVDKIADAIAAGLD